MWDLPDLNTSGAGAAKKTVGYIVNDWQLSGVFTGNSGTRYDLSYSYQTNGANKNLTGSPDYGARIVYLGDPGSGCSDNQYAQFNVSAVTAPSYGSVGLESGRNLDVGLRRQDGRPLPGAHDPPGRQPPAPVPRRRVQRVQRGDHQQPQRQHQLADPDEPDVTNAQTTRTGRSLRTVCASERRLRRGHGRAEHA